MSFQIKQGSNKHEITRSTQKIRFSPWQNAEPKQNLLVHLFAPLPKSHYSYRLYQWPAQLSKNHPIAS